MKRSDRISTIFWFVFALTMIEESYRLDLGTLRFPKAGLLPFLASLVLGILSLNLLLSTYRRRSEITGKGEGFKLNWQRVPKILYAIASLFVYAILLDLLGFTICTMIFIGFLVRVIEPQKWFVVITTAIVASFLSYLLFDVWLKMQLPKGFLGF